MFAVVKIAGQQFKVSKDQTLYVPQIAGNAGDKTLLGEASGNRATRGVARANNQYDLLVIHG